MSTFAGRVKAFNRALELTALLPRDVRIVNPFAGEALPLRLSDAFYEKFYNDNRQRHLILGINPGRFGAALSGVPFTDFKRLEEYCGISAEGHRAHEPSSEFVYKMIHAAGGVAHFYQRFYINSVCPLGFVIRKPGGREVNYNYYDDPALFLAVKPFILRSISRQIALGCSTDVAFCMGVKNGVYLNALNDEQRFFRCIVVLPHPRYIIQYRRAHMAGAIDQYIVALNSAVG